MISRVYCTALLLLSACATTESQPQSQVPIPWVAPLVSPKPIALPVPVGLTPPVPVMVDPNAEPEATPESSGSNRVPPAPLTSKHRPECIPQTVPHRGGDALHDRCADKVPGNAVPGRDVLVNGKHFDALQSQRPVDVLWEVKTDNFDTYSRALRDIVIRKQVTELKSERALAVACGFDFRVGVRSSAHGAALELADPTLDEIIIVMDWC